MATTTLSACSSSLCLSPTHTSLSPPPPTDTNHTTLQTTPPFNSCIYNSSFSNHTTLNALLYPSSFPVILPICLGSRSTSYQLLCICTYPPPPPLLTCASAIFLAPRSRPPLPSPSSPHAPCFPALVLSFLSLQGFSTCTSRLAVLPPSTHSHMTPIWSPGSPCILCIGLFTSYTMTSHDMP